MSKIIGIDLGTTNSVVAVMEGGNPVVVTNPEGGRTTPSVVAFAKGNERLVGQVAKRQAITNPENTIFSIKRFMGRRFDEVNEEMKMVPFRVLKADNGDARVDIKGRQHSPPEISAMILQKLKQAAEEYLGESVARAVITVPAYFNDAQRQATKDAGEIAGLEVLRLVNEPTAAALAYGFDKQSDEKIAVFDFGGGTFDVSILEVGDGVVEVKATNGDTHLGGDNIDQKIIDWLIEQFASSQGVDLSADRMALQRLKEAAEKAKIELSSTVETEINLPFITADAGGPKHLSEKLTRGKLEQLIDDLLQRTIAPCEQALRDASLKPTEIDEVVLVGGSTRLPRVQEMVRDLFGKEPHRGVNPDEVVALGAAVQAGVLGGEVKEMLLLDVTPLSLGIETLGDLFTKIIERNTTIPHKTTDVFSTARNNQTQVEVHVLQGERSLASDNRTLGRFHLEGIPPEPRGVPQIEVAFDLDADGILNVSAKDQATGKQTAITIKGSSGLDVDEIERMRKTAELNLGEDRRRREEIEERNETDTLVYRMEKLLLEHRGKIPENDAKQIEAALDGARLALKDSDIQAVRNARDVLEKASFRLAEFMYDGSAGGDAGSSGTSTDGDVIDVDVVDAEDPS